MQITKIKTKRNLTEEEVFRLAEVKPFSDMRQDSKAINFGLLFNMSYKKFAITVLETRWKDERIEEFIETYNLAEHIMNMEEKHPEFPEKMQKLFAIADYIKTQFFKTYEGLLDRIRRNEANGKRDGYIRSYHGAIRRVPLLRFAVTKNSNKIKIDENFKEYSGYVNITSNTSIQDDECSVVNGNIIKWENSEIGQQNPIIGMTHDSVDFYVLKEGAVDTILEMKKLFEEADEEWQKGIIFNVDFKITDFEESNQYYKSKSSMRLSQFLEKYQLEII